MTYLIPLVVIVVLVLLNGLFVAAEFAVVGARRSRLQELADGGSSAARGLLRVVSHPTGKDRFVAIAQLGITLSSIGLGMYGEQQVASWLYGPLEVYGGLGYAASHTVGTIISLSFITYLHVVFGEMIPKALALQSPEETSVRSYGPMRAFGWLFAPLVILLGAIALGLMRLLRIREPGVNERLYTTSEIAILAEESERGGQLEREQRVLIENIFNLEDRSARDLMTPRTRIEALSTDTTREDFERTLGTSRRSRFPVYEGNLDDVVGVLHVKDFIRAQSQGRPLHVASLVRPLPSVAESTSAEELLAVFKRERVHAALVVDEFGGTAGFVTLHDLIEDVVEDAVDPLEEAWVVRQPDGTLLARGETSLEDLRDEFELPFTSEHAHSIAGLFLQEFGRVPRPGDHVMVSGYDLTATEVKGLQLRQVRIRKVEAPEG